jgi:hypothetical protein
MPSDQWVDVDFEKQRFTVHASKTEHHADSDIRIVPMFPELKPLFRDAFEQAKDGAVYCIDRYKGKYSNVGVHFARIIKRAGLEPWPKLFQNCRSTRETELFKMTGGNIKAVCSWIGNTPAVAMTHYAQITETDLREAAKMTILNEAESSVCKEVHNQAHNPAQNTAEQPRTESHETLEPITISPSDCESEHEFAGACETVQKADHWAVLDSNQRPPACRAGALAS